MSDSIHIIGVGFSTFARSVALACEEKQLAYTLDMSKDGLPIAMKSDPHMDLHPFGKIPVLIHGDRHLSETACIIRYLDNEFGPSTLQGTNNFEKAQIEQWCSLITQYIDFYVVKQYMLELVLPKGDDGSVRYDVIESNRPAAEHALSVVETQLGHNEYLVGNRFSMADIMLAPMLAYNFESPPCLNIVAQSDTLSAYALRLQERKSGQTVLKPLAASL
ncbi:glutathione S-transferase family protein [Gilvimarinus sp. SDUM040013]|uniref:glutathione transferase n=1 Tax=Gilvimarinus gilvus TaxID=3058038 RepID=A0ABU4RTR4_9GAMM|nr:glutathione S-transferase family protein [Gilvimarinus sp. SDUM040013]MDO3386800.1 glutathione S-transferase family protein [Gilvimarinus sp. SDUM040013]MDX6848270.1 glutathione S-transferase family protein [Gilvimarinus sp. SDUM040013]